jgi:hypothetical protein
MTADEGSRRKKSTGFPVVPLHEAVEVIGEAAKYGMTHSRSEFAGYLGHSTTNSGAFKARLAALKDWGLITTGPDTVSLTDLGRRIALPPDPALLGKDLLAAFKSSQAFSDIYGSFAKGQSLETSTIANTAVHRLGIPPASKDRFATSFVRSVVAVGLGEDVGDGKVKLVAEGRGTPASALRHESDDPQVESTELPALGQPVKAADASQGAGIRLPWVIPGGRILLEISLEAPLPASAFAQLSQVTEAVESLIAVLAAAAGDREDG